jgi:hypothetical protein
MISFAFLSNCARFSDCEFFTTSRQAMKEWKEKVESMKKSKARASGSSVMSSSTSEPAQPVSEGIDLNMEASDPWSVVRTPSALSTAACIRIQSPRKNGASSDEAGANIVRHTRSCWFF